jgi:Activator of Hsp90 ATPase homolog 1-like protein
MVIDESTNFVTGGIYREIVEDERLVFTWGATDGWPKIDPERLDDGPLVTVTLSQVSGKTEMTVHVELPASLSEAEVTSGSRWGHNGWRDTVDRLAAELASITVKPMPTVPTPTMQLLEWLAEGSRTYAETIEVWKTSCPRLAVWEDALGDDLVRVGNGFVVLTPRARELLAAR